MSWKQQEDKFQEWLSAAVTVEMVLVPGTQAEAEKVPRCGDDETRWLNSVQEDFWGIDVNANKTKLEQDHSHELF